MNTTAEERERWKQQATEGNDVVEGVHDDIFLRLIAHVEAAEASRDRLRAALEAPR